MRAIITDIREGKGRRARGGRHGSPCRREEQERSDRRFVFRRSAADGGKKPLTWAACVIVPVRHGDHRRVPPRMSHMPASASWAAMDSVEYTVKPVRSGARHPRFRHEQPPDSKIPRFVHIDKAVEHTVRQEAKEGESVSITVTSRSSGHA